MILLLQNIARLFVLLIIQLFVLNNIRFLGYINPYIYLLFFLMLPVKFPRWAELILAFVVGLVIDSFLNTPGIHAFSTVLLSFLRAPVISIYTSVEEGANPEPSFHTFGVAAFIKYVVTLVVIHHFVFYFIEIFSFENFGADFFKTLLNSAVTILIILGVLSLKKK